MGDRGRRPPGDAGAPGRHRVSVDVTAAPILELSDATVVKDEKKGDFAEGIEGEN